ncbi:MAG: hypothetical protein LBR70_05625 [Lactobacillaceae bacterium]|jgi:cobalamin-dependent methionine synthase I|nr:hypothetical protein [Lactobacillaceae bacterium]
MQKIIVKIDNENDEWLGKNIDCYIVGSNLSEKFTADFSAKARKLDKIVLADGMDAVKLCKELDLDGVIIDLSSTEKIKQEMDEAKSEIGSGKFLGVITRSRRHEAMIVSENEPDFVIFKVWKDGFDKLQELLDWYLEFFLLQLAIIPQDDDMALDKIDADIIIFDEKKYKIFVDKNESLD